MEKIKDNLKYIIPIILLVLIVIICYFYFLKKESQEEIILESEPKKIKNEIIEDNKKYVVDIKGAVNSPGVYSLDENSRVIDVINMAGGLVENADTSIVNLSKKITDEMFIIIYTKDEINKYKQDTISTKVISQKIQNDIISIDENNNAEIKNKKTNNSVSIKVEKEDEEKEYININTATKELLLNIPGIGDSKAESIIKYREENGSFNSIEEIKNVNGIGDSLFEKIKEYITIWYYYLYSFIY